MRPCSVCAHPSRPETDRRLLAGDSLGEIARDTGLGRGALQRHRDNHLTQHLAALAAAAETEPDESAPALPAGSFNERLQDLIGQASELMKIARRSGDVRAALQAIRDIRAIVDSQVRLAEIAASNPATALDGQPSCVVILPDNGRNEEPAAEPAADNDGAGDGDADP